MRYKMGSSTIEAFEVRLDELKRVFYPGDSVSGRVHLKLKEDLKLKEMRLECRGEAYVNWPEYSGSYTRYHYNKERYFNAVAVIFGGGKQDENESNSSACISQGSYCFSFKFIIPDKYLPTSFEGHHGNIRYWARAVIDRGLGKKRLKTKPAPFLIGDYVALDDFEHVSDPLIEQGSHETGWLCFRSGRLEMRAEIGQSGFKQGDDIHLSLLVTNETTQDVTCTEVSLVQRTLFVDIEGNFKKELDLSDAISFRAVSKSVYTMLDYKIAKSRKTLSDDPISSVTKEGVFSGWEHDYSNISLTIPRGTYPTLISCKCIAVLYFILIRARLRGRFTRNAYLEIPVIIASSDEQSGNSIQAYQNGQVLSIAQRQKRGKGMFFCVTGKNAFSKDQASSDFDLRNGEENDSFIRSLKLRTNRKRQQNNFEENSDSSSSLSNSVFTPTRESDSSFSISNGQFRKISMV